MQWATAFHANHSLDAPMDPRGSENVKCHMFEIPTKNSSLFFLVLKGPKHEMSLRYTFFQYLVESRL